MISQTDLAAMLCSRLCHDMLSPVGALANGLELLADEQDPQMRARCMELLEQSARISTDKLKFFRLAFGAAGGFGEAIPIDEARSVVEALAPESKRVTINWAIPEPSLPKPAIKVLLNLAQIVARARGDRIAFDEIIGRALQGDLADDEITSRTAAAHMIAVLAEEMDGGLQYKLGDGALVLGAVLPVPEDMIG
jgi:histidine phosphotransferase ChpT